jgi:hypothetical protein
LLEEAASWTLRFGRRQNVAKNAITLKWTYIRNRDMKMNPMIMLYIA